jgi:hypothetical protein
VEAKVVVILTKVNMVDRVTTDLEVKVKEVSHKGKDIIRTWVNNSMVSILGNRGLATIVHLEI